MKKSFWIFNPFTLAVIFSVCLFATHKIIYKNESNGELKENIRELNDLKIQSERFIDSTNYQIELAKLGVKH